MALVYHDRRPAAYDDGVVPRYSGMNMVASLISLLGSVIVLLLGLRFVLALFGANPANPIANFIYDMSAPFAAPFFGLFNYSATLGLSRFEFETLIAMVAYAVLTWTLVRLVSPRRY